MLLVGDKIKAENVGSQESAWVLPAFVADVWVVHAARQVFSSWKTNEAVVVQVAGPSVLAIMRWGDEGDNYQLLVLPQRD